MNARTHFSESTHNDFFTVNGLQSSTGQTSCDFGNVVLKELIDNALDACESAGIEPRVNVVAEYTDNGQMVLIVSDNGAGLDGAIVEKILDFDIRTSDKAAYKSPTRGAQGNALKTIFGIPTALGGGLVTIESKGLRHEISFNVSQSGLNVETLHNVTPIIESIGTTVKVLMPELYGTKPDYWVKAFALFNSHCWVYFENKFSMGKS
jgi:DNA topoisomerase VI subunit B